MSVPNAFATHVNFEFEEAVRAAIRAGGYPEPAEQRPAESLSEGRKYLLDFVIGDGSEAPICIQLFYQGSGGSAQERVPYLALRLMKTVRDLRDGGARLASGWLVLDGPGIVDREFFIGDLARWLPGGRAIAICDREAFVSAAHAHALT